MFTRKKSILILTMIYFFCLRVSLAEVCGSIDIRNSVEKFSKLKNCSVIEGSLSIVLIDNAEKHHFDNISFPSLVEVTDYILIFKIAGLRSLGKLFPNLTLIRGQKTFKEKYSLVVYDMEHLQEVGLSNLASIEKGLVRFQNNPELCYVTSIDWDYITGKTGNFFKHNKLQCKICDNPACPKISSTKLTNSSVVTNDQLCWSENVCQKLCSKNCKNNCYFNEIKCCPDQCRGGCYEKYLTDEQLRNETFRLDKMVGPKERTVTVCAVCKNVEHKGQCLDKCPYGYYKYKNRRCLTKDECIKLSKKYSSYTTLSFVLKAIKINNDTAVCEEDCPSGYMINPENEHSCIECGKYSSCVKHCLGGRIETIALAEKFKKCTNINGDLIISLQENSEDLQEKLTESLGSIQTISGYLRISKSYFLHTLHFLKNLREIRGQRFDRQHYSLLVIDNANLEDLFLWNKTSNTTQLNILKGKVFFQLNPKLCLNKIDELKNYTNVKDFSPNDVSEYSNGDKAFCLSEKIYLFLRTAFEDSLVIEWTPFHPYDLRTLLGYDIWYREAPEKNITSYLDGKDACNDNKWKIIDHDFDGGSNLERNEIEIISQLKPATQYAILVRTNILFNRNRENPQESLKTGISDIEYFYTKPSQPERPDILDLACTNPFEIDISWSPPKRPNGEIKYYKVLVEKKKTEFIDDLDSNDVCELKNSEIYMTENKSIDKYKDDSAKTTNDQSCKCNSKVSNENDRQEDISFENTIHNTIYKEKNEIVNITDIYLNNLTYKELLIYLDRPKFIDVVLQNNLTVSQKESIEKIKKDNDTNLSIELEFFNSFNLSIDAIKKLKLNVSNLAKLNLVENEILKFNFSKAELNTYLTFYDHYNFLRKEYKSPQNIRSFYKRDLSKKEPFSVENNNLNLSAYEKLYIVYETKKKLTGLDHFTDYIIKVSACQNDSSLISEKQCSDFQTQSITTQLLGGANDIDSKQVNVIFEKNSTVFIKWPEPSKPNGEIRFYRIELKKENSDPNQYCVLRKTYSENDGGYFPNNLPPGNYSLRILAGSVAGKGNWTNPVYFVIPEKSFELSRNIIFVIIFIFFIFIAMIVTSIYYFNKKNASKIYASVNPDYITYEPDEWEVERKNVEVLEKIGEGNYGLVYRGEFKTKIDETIEVAIKTVNPNKLVQDRNKFLSEASLMKKIDCYHIVSFIGVVSKGTPVLVLMEMMSNGDLKSYLKSHRPHNYSENYDKMQVHEDIIGENYDSRKKMSLKQKNDESLESSELKYLTLNQITTWAAQIADGMAYLAANKFIHRDLAARNCLVSKELIVKIGDFGMAKDVYTSEYYQKNNKAPLPVRWMSPEALKDGEFTIQSDVWSYGIVLWEMVTLGSQPYLGLSNDEVIKFITDENRRMPKPTNCPDHLYAIMENCWMKNPKSRSSFYEIVELLLPSIDQKKFEEKSFYHENLKKLNSDDDYNQRKLNKNEYLNDLGVLQNDGSDEPLTKNEFKSNESLKKSIAIQFKNSGSLDELYVKDFEMKNDRFLDLRDDNQLILRQNYFNQSSLNESSLDEHLKLEFSENESTNSISSQTTALTKQTSNKNGFKVENVVVEMNLDKETELKNRKNFIKSSSCSLSKNRDDLESMSCQSNSSSSTCNSNNDKNEKNLDNLIKNQNLSNGGLSNGDILLNS